MSVLSHIPFCGVIVFKQVTSFLQFSQLNIITKYYDTYVEKYFVMFAKLVTLSVLLVWILGLVFQL